MKSFYSLSNQKSKIRCGWLADPGCSLWKRKQLLRLPNERSNWSLKGEAAFSTGVAGHVFNQRSLSKDLKWLSPARKTVFVT
jgi:hypothetical protein